nr:aureocin A53 family class IId bacteriocin [Caldalkalibacillus mannanilyticus]
MSTFLEIIAQLTDKAAKWAWNNSDQIYRWIREGLKIPTIIEFIYRYSR